VQKGGGAGPDVGDIGVEVRVGMVVSVETYTMPNLVLLSNERDC